MIYLRLFLEFFHMGLFAIGGGMATLPFLYDMSDRTGWFSRNQLADTIAVSESTPGPIGINMATYAGFNTAGVVGSVIATFGLVLPSVLIILLIALFLQRFRTNRYVNAAFYGLRPASAAMIAASALVLIKENLFLSREYPTLDHRVLVLMIALLVLTRFKLVNRLHPIWLLLSSALVGIVFSFAGI